jgi:hypothetical protein
MIAVQSLRRSGVRIDYLAEHPKVYPQFSAAIWIDFAVQVGAGVGASAVIAIAGYLRGRIRRARQSKVQPQLDLIHGRPDGTFLRVAGTDTDAVLKAFYASLATSAADPTAKEALLRLAAGADPSAELKALKPKATAVDAEDEAGDQDDTHEAR